MKGAIYYAASLTGLLAAVPLTGVHSQATGMNYDGSYTGRMILTQNNAPGRSSVCLSGPYNKMLTITRGAVHFVYNGTYNTIVDGAVTADGVVSGSGSSYAGGTRLAGRIQANVFTGEVGSGYCTYSLQLTRK